MTLPTSGNQIKFSDIASEFGYTPNNKLGEYRVNQSIAGKDWVLDSGIPSSGQIKFSDFHGKRLNIVVESGTGGDEFNVTLTNYWSTKTKTCVGGFKSPESSLSSQGDKKYHVILRRDYGGSGSVNTSVKSGSWPSGSILNVYVSNNATIYGRGGDGGYGGWSDGGSGGNGSPGQNAIGFSYDATLTIESGSGIIAGAGGGGGGGGNHHNPDEGPSDPTFTGGNGGGGRGNPGGGGGGQSGTKSKGGDGYEGGGWGWDGGNKGHAGGGGGGGGWDAGSIGAGSRGGGAAGNTNGSGGSGGWGGAPPGSGGSPGNAILRTSGTTVTVVNNGTCSPSSTPVANDSFN